MNKRRLPFSAWLRGEVRLRVTGALPAAFLNECARRGIPLRRAAAEGALAVCVSLPSPALRRAEQAAVRCGCEVELLDNRGWPETARRLRRRAGFAAGVLAVLLALFWSSLYIWDIRVTENPTEVSDGEILAVLEELDVGVGTWWPGLRSDMLRARALQELRELGFLAVNIHGSRAEVIVRGRVEVPELWQEREAADVTASRSGIVAELRVLEGDSAVAVGDTVLSGEVLVSGTRMGLLAGERQVRARAEVWARTWHEITAISPLTRTQRVPSGKEKTVFSLIWGKRRMNFALCSGIYEGTCDKMTNIYPLALPGAPRLPLALQCEHITPVALVETEKDREALRAGMEARLMEELTARLAPGSNVVTTHFSHSESGGRAFAVLRAECRERIDRITPRG